MKSYVVGFLFSPDSQHVVLIKKLKPAWQQGKLNGVGGLIEAGESAWGAMVREFKEEAGLAFYDWDLFLVMNGLPEFCKLFFFRGWLGESQEPKQIRSLTKEQVNWYDTLSLQLYKSEEIIPNLKWLIPLAVSGESGRIEMRQQQCIDSSEEIASAALAIRHTRLL